MIQLAYVEVDLFGVWTMVNEPFLRNRAAASTAQKGAVSLTIIALMPTLDLPTGLGGRLIELIAEYGVA